MSPSDDYRAGCLRAAVTAALLAAPYRIDGSFLVLRCIRMIRCDAPTCLPGEGGCNPIPGKIEIRWPSLDLLPLLRYNSISRGWGDCDERRCSGHWSGPRTVALGCGRLGQSVAGRPPSTAGLGLCGRSGFERVLRPHQGARRGGWAAGNRSPGGTGGLALCHAGRDRLGAGDRPAVPAAPGLSLAVRRCADQSRPAGVGARMQCCWTAC